MNENYIIDLIASVGFPMVVSIYLLVRLETKIENFTNAINDLNKIIGKCTKHN